MAVSCWTFKGVKNCYLKCFTKQTLLISSNNLTASPWPWTSKNKGTIILSLPDIVLGKTDIFKSLNSLLVCHVKSLEAVCDLISEFIFFALFSWYIPFESLYHHWESSISPHIYFLNFQQLAKLFFLICFNLETIMK